MSGVRMTRAQVILENIKKLYPDAFKTQQEKNKYRSAYNIMKMQWRRNTFSLKPPGDRTSRYTSMPM